MNVERVLAAAAALREFTAPEIAAYCDVAPDAIVELLDASGDVVERTVPPPADGPARWRVVEPDGIRRRLDGASRRAHPALADSDDPADQLLHVEKTLLRCATERSGSRRRTLVSTALNHLRQATAMLLGSEQPWWELDLSGALVEEELRRLPDPAAGLRLRFDVTNARLAAGHVTARPVSTRDLIGAVADIRGDAVAVEGDDWLSGAVRGLVDLATAQVAPANGPAVNQLVVAVTRRRLAVQAEHDPAGAMASLGPVVRHLAERTDEAAAVADLYRTVHHHPDGDHHAVVYKDLLALLPGDVRYHRRGEPLPGALVEVVGDRTASEYLRRCASTLETDLRRSDIRSDAGLIGQAAQVLAVLVDEGRGDSGVHSSGEATRIELNRLAKTHMWPPTTGAGPS